MSITIGSNIAALKAQRRLELNSKSIGNVFERLSSGQRINRASDDAAGLAVASALNTKSRVFNQGLRNLNDGISLLNVADSALASLGEIVTRQRELAEQAGNGVYSDEQRIQLNSEAQALAEEYQRILDSSEYNGRNLFDIDEGIVRLQAGFGVDGSIAANYLNIHTQEGGGLAGDGTYTDYVRSAGGGTSGDQARLLVGDMNNDGIDDIISTRWVDQGAGTVQLRFAVYLGEDGGTTFGLDEYQTEDLGYFSDPSVALSVELIDAHSDGDLDIRLQFLTDIQIGSGHLINDLNPGGTFSLGPFQSIVKAVADSSSTTVTGDFNNDGVQDQVVGTTSGIQIRIQDTTFDPDLQVGDSLVQDTFSLNSDTQALSALDAFAENGALISRIRGQIGASQSRVQTATSVLQVSSESFRAAESRIVDADMAQETAELTRRSILNQSAAAVLSQANLQPSIALNLLRG